MTDDKQDPEMSHHLTAMTPLKKILADDKWLENDCDIGKPVREKCCTYI